MASGSPQTIDRIQVEFSTNIQDLVAELAEAETRLSDTTASFESSEVSSKKFVTATNSASTVLEKAGKSSVGYATSITSASTATVSASTSLGQFTTSAVSAETAITGTATAATAYTHATTAMGAATAAATTGMGNYVIAANSQMTAADAAAANLQKNAAESVSFIDMAKDALNSMKGLLGLFGISVGIGALIGQLKDLAAEAGNAGKAYGKMYNAIYYTIGELTESQKELANTLGTDFDKSKVAETIARLSVLFPDAETTIMADGTSALETLSRELLWMDAKGFGDVSTTITGMNEAFKKWKISTDDATTALSYLRATYQDTNVDIETQLSHLAQLDEAGTALGMTYQDMADLIGAANIAGNLDDLSYVGTTFETQYGNKVTAMRAALLGNDFSAVAPFIETYRMDGTVIAGMFDEVAADLQVDPVLARVKADEFAETITQMIFQAANEMAADTGSKTRAADIWKELLGLDGTRGGRIANRLADMSLSAVNGYDAVKTTQRDQVTAENRTTTYIVTDINGLGVTDVQRQIEGYEEAWYKNTFPGLSSWTPTLAENIWNYERVGGYDPYSSNLMGTTTALEELFGDTIAGIKTKLMLNPITVPIVLGTDIWESLLSLIFPLDETEVQKESLAEPFTPLSWMEDIGQAIADAIGSILPIGTASAADEVVFPEDIEQPADYTDPLQEIGDAVVSMNDGISGMNEGITGLTGLLSGSHGDVYITQNFYTDTVDSYTVKNAAAQAVRTAQAESYTVRA